MPKGHSNGDPLGHMLVEVPLRTHVALALSIGLFTARERESATTPRLRRASAGPPHRQAVRRACARFRPRGLFTAVLVQVPCPVQIAARCVRVGRSRTLLKRRLLRGAPELAGDPRSVPECVSILGMDLCASTKWSNAVSSRPCLSRSTPQRRWLISCAGSMESARSSSAVAPGKSPFRARPIAQKSCLVWLRPVRSPMKRMRS